MSRAVILNFFMKNTSKTLIDCLLIILGIPLIPIGFVKWQSEGFVLDTAGTMGSFEGNMGFFTMLLGLALISYAIINFLIFRVKRSVISEPSSRIAGTRIDQKIEDSITTLVENDKKFNSELIVLIVAFVLPLVMLFFLSK